MGDQHGTGLSRIKSLISEDMMGLQRQNDDIPIASNAVDAYWQHTAESYSAYPTVRHRKDFLLTSLRLLSVGPDSTILDYGCGEGTVLRAIRDRFSIPEHQLAGYDVSASALSLSRAKVPGASFFYGKEITHRYFDYIVCSEVIEHTVTYKKILNQLYTLLNTGGYLLLTTQSGRIHASDRYVGHTQHFRLDELISILEEIGFSIVRKKRWGFPFFTLQKYLTNINFTRIQKSYLEGSVKGLRKYLFSFAYHVYHIHNSINAGPQLFIIVQKNHIKTRADTSGR